MNCDACGASNDADARFCEDCGAPQARRCPSCDTAVRANARFCKGCGASLDDDRAGPGDTRRATRKTVTVLFADLGGSTGFEERVDPETARAVLGRYHETLGSIAEDLGAGTVKFAGDGVMAVWGVPEIAADDADRAVRAGIAMQVAFERIEADVAQRFDTAISLRVAINTGEVVVGDDDADIVGDALNVAARLEKDCPPGRVVVGDETWRATRGDHDFESLGEVEVTGRDGAVGVHLLRGAAAPEASMPFVGRDAEAAQIRALFDAAVGERALRLVSIVGEPGVGKTTLARSCTEDLGVPIVAFSCTADSAVALGPIVDVLRTIVDDDGAPAIGSLVPDDVADRDRVVGIVTDLVTGGAAHTVEETFRSLRRLVEVTATDEPLVIVIDDIQWADPLLLDFVEHLVEWVRDSPVLVVALARPEIRDVRPTLGEASRWVDVAIALEGLDSEATRRLAAELLGADDVPVELADRLPESTRGNPLFVRELMRMLVHDGVLEQDDDVWRLTVDVDAIDVPPTVKSLLSTRIERLPDDERRMIEVGGVIGTDFDLGAVAALLGTSASAVLTLAERLRRLQLVEPAGTYAGDDPVWRFHHVLIREVAYGRLLKADRAELHERLADHRAEQGGADVDEVVARHLDAAHGYRRELGDTGDHVAALGVRAATRYLAAAQRALDRDELTSAASLAANGVSVAGDDRSLAAELAMLGCEASLTALDAAAGAALVDRFAESIDDPDDPWLVCFASQLAMLTDPEALPTADADLTVVIDDFSAAGDRRGLAKAHLVRARVRARLGRVADCEADLDQALVAAREADDRRRVTAVLGAAPAAALWGPSPVPRAGGRCLDVIRLQRITTAAPSVEATSVRCQAVLEALRGRIDNARSMIGAAHQTVRDLGLRHGQAETELFEGIIETIAGDHAAAEPHFRAALDGLGSLGVGVDAGQAAALLAKSLLAQDRLDEADRYASESEKLAGQNLKTAIAWRTARAEILAAQGRTDDAVALAREAVDIGAGTDIVLDHADACLTLSRVLAAAGDDAGAARARDEADRLHEAKGAEALLSSADGPSSAPPTDEPAGRVESRLGLDNSAARAVANVIPRAHDEDFASAFADSFVRLDHRSVMNTPDQDRDAVVESFRHLLELTGDVALVPVAVRGDRLVLHDVTFAQPDGFDLQFLGLAEVDPNGRITAMLSFDHDDLARATTELDQRFHAGEGAPHAPNGRLLTEWNDAALDHDWDRFRACLHHEFVNAFHAQVWPPLDGDELARVYGDVMAEGPTDIWYSAIEWPAMDVAITRSHRRIDRDGQDLLWDWLLVWQFRDGKIWRLDTFDADQSAEAFALVDELTRSTDDRRSVDNRAARAVEAAIERLRRGDPDLASAFVESFTRVDHREVLSAPMQDRAAFVENLRELYDMTGAVTITPVAVRGERVVLFEVAWTEHDGFELRLLAVGEIDRAGGITAVATFDADDLQRAHADLDARYQAGEGARLCVDNHAARAVERAIARVRDDDPDLATSFAESFTRIDHRPVTTTPEQDRDAFVASVRELHALTGEISLTPIAVRGDRLVLHDFTFAERDGFGVRLLALTELDTNGDLASITSFEADDLRAAHAELDARYWAGEGAEHAEHGRLFTEWIEASLDADWDRFRAIFHEQFVNQIHGQVFPTLDVDGLVELNADVMREGAADLWYSSVEWPAPDVALSLSHRRIDRDGQVLQWDYLMVHQFRARKIWRLDSFDLDRADEAFALVDELTRSTPDPLPVDNRATRAVGKIAAAYEASDLDRLMAVYSDDVVSEDRRRVVASEPRRGAEVRDAHAETLEVISHYDYEPLAVRGDALTLTRLWLSDDSGTAIEMLSVGEVDDDGRVSSYVLFDPDDFLEAMLELDRRYFAGEGRDHAHNAPGFTDFYAGTMRGDLDAVRRAMTDDFQLVWPGGLWPDMDADGMVEGTAEILADDTERRMWVSAVEWVAPDIEWSRAHRHEIDADGVETQWEWFIVSQYRDGLAHRVHCFEPENVDAARAFVESLVGAAEQPTADPFPIENRAAQLIRRVAIAWNAGDPDRLLDHYEMDVLRDDRRSVVSSGIARGEEARDGTVALAQVLPRVTSDLLAVRGDRLAMSRTLLSSDSASEVELFLIMEVSDSDRVSTWVCFDPDEFDAAMVELDRMYYAGEGAAFAENGNPLTQYVSAIRHRDLETLPALVHDDWEFHGHEGTLWTAVGLDEYGDMVRETFADATWSQVWQPTVCWLSPEVAVAPFHHRSRYADGSEAEWRFVNVGVWDGGRMHELHTFADEDAEAAFGYAHERARAVDRLPLSFPNQALWWTKRRKGMVNDRDGGLGRFAPEFRRIDRRKVLHDADADREHYLRSNAEMGKVAPMLGSAPIAGRGDLLSCVLIVGGRDGARIPLLVIDEYDADGIGLAAVTFDGDDIADAMLELDRRYYAGEGAAFAAGGGMLSAFVDANCRRDLDRYRSLLADDFVARTHSGLSWPDQDSEEQVRLNREVMDGADEYAMWLRTVHWHSDTVVSFIARRRTVTDGVEREWDMATVARIEGGKVRSLDFWRDLADLDRAIDAATAMAEEAAHPLALTNASTSLIHVDGAPPADRLEPDLERIDHRSTVFGERRIDRDELLRGVEELDLLAPHRTWTTLAVRGDRASLIESVHGTGDGRELRILIVGVISERGRWESFDLFDVDELTAALQCLDERYYADEGAAFAAGGAVVTDFVDANSRQDWDRYRACMSDDFVARVHTGLPWPELSVDEAVQTSREIADGTDEYRAHVPWLRWFSPDVALIRMHRSAVTEGAESSWDVLAVVHVVDGRIRSLDMWRDLVDLDAALAEAEAVVLGLNDPLPVEAARTRAQAVYQGRNPTDVDLQLYLAETFAPDAVRRDHRTGVSAGTTSGTELLESIRLHFEQFPSVEVEILAVRGERCVLVRRTLRNDDGYEMAFLMASASSPQGQLCDMTLYDVDALADAVIELDRLYLEHELDVHPNMRAGIEFEMAQLSGDWSAHRRFLTDDWTFVSHSGPTAGLAPSPDDYVAFVREQSEWRDPVIPIATVVRWVTPEIAVLRVKAATAPGGSESAWEIVIVAVWRDGVMIERHQWEAEGVRDALAFAESLAAATDDPLPVENALTRFLAAMPVPEDEDSLEDAFRQRYSDDVVRVDHRTTVSSSDSTHLFDSMREILAVRGETLALGRMLHADENGFEFEFFTVLEAGDDGRVVRQDVFDELNEAHMFLDERFAETVTDDVGTAQAWLEIARAFRDHAWDRFGSMFAPGFFVEGSTGVSAGRNSADAMLGYLDGLHAEGDVTQIVTSMRFLGNGVIVWRHERAAAGLTIPAEWSYVIVLRWGVHGIESMHQFEAEQAVEAMALAEAMACDGASDPLPVENDATRLAAQYEVAYNAGDDLAVFFTADCERIDRRKTVSGEAAIGPAAIVGAVEEMRSLAPMTHHLILAVRGERLALGSMRFDSEDGFVVDALVISETDRADRFRSVEFFDVDDLPRAMLELERQYYAGEGAAHAVNGQTWIDAYEGVVEHNFEQFQRVYAEDAEVRWHGLLWDDQSGAEQAAHMEQSVAASEQWRWYYTTWRWVGPDVAIATGHGVAVEDGMEAEWEHVQVGEWRDGKVVRMDIWEIEQTAEALAYAEELAQKSASPS